MKRGPSLFGEPLGRALYVCHLAFQIMCFFAEMKMKTQGRSRGKPQLRHDYCRELNLQYDGPRSLIYLQAISCTTNMTPQHDIGHVPTYLCTYSEEHGYT